MTPDPEKLLSYQSHARELARALLRDEDLAGDVSQDAWAAALAQGSAPRSWRAWFSTTVKNCAFSALRRQRVRPEREHLAARPTAIPTPAEITQREDTRRKVVDAVLALDPMYRTPLILRYWESLPPRRIAQELDLPVETVRTRLRRGLALLRKKMSDESGSTRAWQMALLPLAGIALPKAAATTAALTGVGIMTAKAKAGLAAAVFLIIGAGLTLFMLDGGPSQEEALPRQEDAAKHASSGEAVHDPKQAEPKIGTVVFDGQEPAPEDSPEGLKSLGSLAIRVVHKSTGEAAPHQLVRILPFGAQDPFFSEREVRCDRYGEITVKNLAPGGCWVSAHLGSAVRARITADEETPVTVELPRGMILKGVVVDGKDRPIANADVHCSREASLGATRKVGVTDADGQFMLEFDAAESWRCVGARAEGYAPSNLHILMGPAGIEKTIKVILDQAGGAVNGVIHGPDDKPVANALVIIGTREHRQFTLPDGLRGCTPDPLPIRTNSEGRFELTTVPPGTHEIRVRARGSDGWKGSVEVVAHQTSEVFVTLQKGMTIEGTITEFDGKPAERMQVMVGRYGSPFSSFTRTDARGHYRLTGVASGDIKISASHDKLGTVAGTLHGNPGAELAWSATLEKGFNILARLLDEGGKPISGWTVSTAGFQYACRTDKEGRAVLENCKDGEYTINVLAPDASSYPVLKLKGIRPNGPELVMRIKDEQIPGSSIRGEVLSAEGEPLPAARISIRHSETGYGGRIYSTDQVGRFSISPIPAGTYTMTVRVPGEPILRPESFTVQHRQDLDLGTLKIVEGGGLEVTIRPLDGVNTEKLWISARRVNGRGSDSLDRAGLVATNKALAPGRYRVTAAGTSIANTEQEVVVRAGRTTTLQLDVRPGLACRILLVAESSATLPQRATIRITDVAGRYVTTVSAFRRAEELRSPLKLPPGTYSLHATAPDGRSGTGQLVVLTSSKEAATARVLLQ